MEAALDELKLQIYDEYKDSGEGWIGKIPSHWEVKRLKHIFHEKKKKINVRLNCGSISYGEVVFKDDGKIPESTKASYQEVLAGDFLINPLNLNYDLTSLRIALSKLNVVVSSGYIVLQSSIQLDKTYYKWLLHRYDVAYMKLLGSGVRQTISFTHIANSLLISPPLQEQLAISKFLEKKTQAINGAITIKQKQIDLLTERKQILIHKAVTQGLDANAKLKDSHVNWIGKIPKHWEILPGMRIFRESKLQNIKMKEKVVLSLSYGKIIVKPVEKLYGLVPESFETYQIATPNDIIIRGTDLQNDKTSLRTGLVKTKGIITSAYLNLRTFSNDDPRFIHIYLHSLDITKVFYKFGSGLRQNLSYADFKHLPIATPPLIEQKAIVSYIDNLENRTLKSIRLREQEIEKLHEFKESLINNVITGKIKVYHHD